ncbi:hypothetical protein [Pseudobutyrivibrio ruminis]|uniref:Uncharacterized protein n=1 Tax=Pseudobutyrivibrio ruminis TaxID=46206 RepID=A0A2G3DTF9_9FIRM|nr:hypothetical protein [Pseudobutyrivibrio ruminis]PHU34231.1 hypothetical protein CSX01_11740 [Pseudobutyrivibrio ruminis]
MEYIVVFQYIVGTLLFIFLFILIYKILKFIIVSLIWGVHILLYRNDKGQIPLDLSRDKILKYSKINLSEKSDPINKETNIKLSPLDIETFAKECNGRLEKLDYIEKLEEYYGVNLKE